LEVYQFARDAAVAEQWLIAQEPYLYATELGVSSFLNNCIRYFSKKSTTSSFIIINISSLFNLSVFLLLLSKVSNK